MCKKLRKNICLLMSFGIAAQTGLGTTARIPCEKVKAAVNYTNAAVSSQGKNNKDAVIRGENASVVYDETLKSDVLDLKGGAFGASWLQLPALFESGCKDGFTFSMKYQLYKDNANYSRLFQFTPLPFGTGETSGYSSPDISVDLNDKTAYRCSIFAGKTSKTENDKKHRAIFPLNAAPDSEKWHELSVVYTPETMTLYIDGTAVENGKSDNLADTMNSLFSENVLPSYIYNSVGHSLYNDSDIRARIDDVAFYDYALSSSEIKSLPSGAQYLYTFESDTVKEGTASSEPETSVTFRGTVIKSIPELQTVSPDGSLKTKIWSDSNGSYYYSVHKSSNGTTGTVIEPSKLGIVTKTEDLSSGLAVQTAAASSVSCDETYSMPYGKHSTIRNNYNEITVPFKKGDTVISVIFRVYDDGIGFRYALSHGADIKEEASEVVFPEKGTLWGNMPNATYEWDFTEFNMDKVKSAWSDYSFPLTGNFSDKYWVLLSEANVFNESDPYCAGCLRTTGGSRALQWKFGVKTESVSMKNAFHTPWRAAVISDSLNGMSSSDLILNLNPPSVLDDISWVKPGKAAWSWWSSGGDSPIEYHTQKDYIDFAAENGWEYVCLDFGWALWDDSAAKVRELCEYGEKKGVGIYLWYGVNNKGHNGYRDSAGNPAYPYYSLLDEATIVREFERISALGVKGVKVDYYESDTQETMKQMYLCMDIAAKNKLMVLFHGCTVPRGESRTYPNIVSYEAVNGTEYYKWFTSPSLENRITYTFTRNVVGSADFTPTGLPVYGIKATAGFAIADAVNIESGIQHFAQSVYTYQGTTALPVLNDVPVVWDDLRILDGRPMKYNITARRSGEDWYIGASTIEARNIEIKLSDFISDDGTYTAYIFGDNEDGSALKTTVIENLTKNSTIKQSIMANGGFVIKLTKNGMKLTTPYSDYQFYEAEKASLSGEAKVEDGKNAKYSSGYAYVGYVGGKANNSVTFTDVNVKEPGEYTLRVYYVSGEKRELKVDVNGQYVTTMKDMYANRNDWSGIAAKDTSVKLNAGKNTIKLYNDNAYGPSIDRIAVVRNSAEKLKGDLNFDGKTDAADLIIMQKAFFGMSLLSKQQKNEADINTDGTINIADVVLLKNIIIDII